MKLSEWARHAGVRYETAWKWYKAGILPVPATRLPTGIVLVLPPAPPLALGCPVREGLFKGSEGRPRAADCMTRHLRHREGLHGREGRRGSGLRT